MEQQILDILYKLLDKMDRVENDIAHMHSDITELKSNQAQMQSDIAILKSSQAQMQSDITALKSSQTQMQSDIAILKSSQAQMQSDITALKSTQTQIQSDITALKSTQTQMQTDINTIKQDVARIIDHSDQNFAVIIHQGRENSKKLDALEKNLKQELIHFDIKTDYLQHEMIRLRQQTQAAI